MRRGILGSCGALLLAFAALMCGAGLLAAEKGNRPDTAEIKALAEVRAALEAEAAGDNQRRNTALQSAAKMAPGLDAVNWHSAHVRVGERWLDVPEAEAHAISDPQVAEYRKLRDEAKDNSKLLRNLARWCMKAGWDDTARLHYGQLLARPDADAEEQQEAIQKLDLCQVNGSWVSGKELAARRNKARIFDEALAKWRPRLAKLQPAIDGDDFKRRDWAIKELQKVDDPRAIPAFETFVTEGDGRFQEELVRQLARLPDYAATEALVQFAVLPAAIVIRDEAIKALRERSVHEYCPLLMNGLVAPIESRFEIQRLPNGVVTYRQAWSRELPDKKVAQVTASIAAPRFRLPLNGTTTIDPRRARPFTIVEDDMMWRLQQHLVGAAATRANDTQLEVLLANAPVNESNRPVFYALQQTTGQQLPDNVGQWWQWWQDYNQYHWPKPTYCQYTTNYSQYVTRPPVYAIGGQSGSCFLAGTRIRAQTGLVAVETIRPGDRVLSQDQDTGELKYKVILRTTLRPPTKMVRLTIGKEEIVTTLGHPFWVCGFGWKMAKQLQTGDWLHSLQGAVQLNDVESLAREEQAHNLVVADFNTYFVGETSLLVHDNELRRPTRAIVPGLVEDVVSK